MASQLFGYHHAALPVAVALRSAGVKQPLKRPLGCARQNAAAGNGPLEVAPSGWGVDEDRGLRPADHDELRPCATAQVVDLAELLGNDHAVLLVEHMVVFTNEHPLVPVEAFFWHLTPFLTT